MHHPTDRIIHTTAFVTPVMEHWLEREIAQWVHPMKDRFDDPSHHERTLLPWSYISLPECFIPGTNPHYKMANACSPSQQNEARKKNKNVEFRKLIMMIAWDKPRCHSLLGIIKYFEKNNDSSERYGIEMCSKSVVLAIIFYISSCYTAEESDY